MTRILHKLSITFYALVVLVAIVYLACFGYSFYKLPLEERFYDPHYALLKPSGLLGHGLGIIGTLFIVIGLFSYMIRKRFKVFSRLGVLKYWLEFHIFMCTLGSVFILFHTSFKFGGLVSIGFWSMVIVWISGVVGRFIYLQIPHSIEGKELSLQEVQNLKEELDDELTDKYSISIAEIKTTKVSKLKLKLLSKTLSKEEHNNVKRLIKTEQQLAKRIGHLDKMQRMFKYWHVAHLPFALIMLIIVAIHVGVALFFGYHWIF